jgi:hypothetical protein
MMSTMTWLFILFVVVLIIGIYFSVNQTPEEKKTEQFGKLNAAMKCPHCEKVGKVRTKGTLHKKGISGGKATAAVLTGGVSILATGLSRKESGTQAHCENCSNTWVF